MNVDLREDADGRFHYFAYEPGRKNARREAAALCGRAREGMREAAWFRVNDHRGQVHYVRGCDSCRERLVV